MTGRGVTMSGCSGIRGARFHGEAQVLVCLVECLAGLAAERQSGGDDAVGDGGGRR